MTKCVTIDTDEALNSFVLATRDVVIRAWEDFAEPNEPSGDGFYGPNLLRGVVTMVGCYAEAELSAMLGAVDGFGINTVFKFHGNRRQIVALARARHAIDLLTDLRFEFVDPSRPETYRLGNP